MPDPKTLTNPKVLADLSRVGFNKMKRGLRTRYKLLSAYCGRLYKGTAIRGMPEAAPSAPVNLMHQAATTLVPNLISRDPRARITATFLPYRNYAAVAELALDHLIEEIKLKDTMRRVITDSIFFAGFTKTSIAASGYTLQIDGVQNEIGQPYCDRVDPNDMMLDPVVRDWEEQRVIGDRTRVDLNSDLLDSGLYDADTLIKLADSRYTSGAAGGGTEASLISGTQSTIEGDSILPQLDLVELYLPREQIIVTLPWTADGGVLPMVLRQVDHEGPEDGPYRMLGYAFVPDNILPVAPASIWYELHLMTNKIAQKAAEQADRQKNVLAFEGSAVADAQAIVDADDGQTVRVDNIDAIKEVDFGGVTKDNYIYIEWAKQQFAEMAMNIDLLSGVATNEPTATQAEMIQSNTTVRLADMQNIVYDHTADVMKALFFYLHTDPLIELPLVKREKGVDQQVVYTPEMREGDWLDYNIKVRPYSMARQDPNTKTRRLMEFCANIMPAFAQTAQMLGGAFNLEAALNIIGREMGIEELDEIINSPMLAERMAMMQQQLEMSMQPDLKPALSLASQAGGGIRIGQPNPLAGMTGGVTPQVETNQMRQDTAAEIQAGAM